MSLRMSRPRNIVAGAATLTLAVGAIVVSQPITAPAQAAGQREFFTDTFGDPLDYSNTEDVALVNEGPIQGNSALPTLGGGSMRIVMEKLGYFSPLWGGYDTGDNKYGSEAVGHDREGNIHPIDPAVYSVFRARVNVSAEVGAGVQFYTCPAGVKDSCQTANQFITKKGWNTYEFKLPQGKPVSGIRFAVSPDEKSGPVTVEVDWAGVYGSGAGNTDGQGGVQGPVPEILNPDVAGAVPFVFPLGGKEVPYVGRQCPNTDWANVALNNPWDMNDKSDFERVDGYVSHKFENGQFLGIADVSKDKPAAGDLQLPGDPQVWMNLGGKSIDPKIWKRKTTLVPFWAGTFYGQQFGGDGGWVERMFWLENETSDFQVGSPAVEYPNDTTISVDMDDPTPYDGSTPGTGIVDLSVKGAKGWSSLSKVIKLRIDMTESYVQKLSPIDQVLLATDDCSPTNEFDIVYSENNPGAETSYTFYKSASYRGPWEAIGSEKSTGAKQRVWTWKNAPTGTWWIKVVGERDGLSGENRSTGPVTIASPDYAAAFTKATASLPPPPGNQAPPALGPTSTIQVSTSKPPAATPAGTKPVEPKRLVTTKKTTKKRKR